MDRRELLEKCLEERILILDGAMGTMLQKFKLTESDYRGERFRNWSQDLKGNNELLSLTKPESMKDILFSEFEICLLIISRISSKQLINFLFDCFNRKVLLISYDILEII